MKKKKSGILVPKYESSTTATLLVYTKKLHRRYGNIGAYPSRNKRFA